MRKIRWQLRKGKNRHRERERKQAEWEARQKAWRPVGKDRGHLASEYNTRSLVTAVEDEFCIRGFYFERVRNDR